MVPEDHRHHVKYGLANIRQFQVGRLVGTIKLFLQIFFAFSLLEFKASSLIERIIVLTSQSWQSAGETVNQKTNWGV